MLKNIIAAVKNYSYLITGTLLTMFGLINPIQIVHAADCPSNLSSLSGLGLPAYCNAIGTDSTGLLTHAINLLLAFLGMIAVLFIIIGGYKMIISRGDEKKFESGRQTVTYALIGLVVAILAFAMITVIGNTLGGTSSNSSSTSGSNSNTSNSSSANTGTSSNTAVDCSSVTSTDVQASTTDANKNQSTTFNAGDTVLLISKAANPAVQQCASSIFVTITSSSTNQTFSGADNGTVSKLASSLVSGGSGTTTLTWTYTNTDNNDMSIGTFVSGPITVNPASGS
jgi:hypothetical protein